MTALLIDIGNTRLKWGLLEDGEIHKTGHIDQGKIREQGLTALTSRLPRYIDAVFASNVAGNSFATRLTGVLHAHCGVDVRFAKSEAESCGVTNSYSQPRRMGVDRWVAMIGAWAEVEDTCLIVDAGTAVTIDAIDSSGQHLGGQIILGVELMTQALASSTSDLPELKSKAKSAASDLSLFASSTAPAIAQGSIGAVVGAVERAARILQKHDLNPTLILTGGDASRILNSLDDEPLHRPHLVLQGLAHLLEHRQ